MNEVRHQISPGSDDLKRESGVAEHLFPFEARELFEANKQLLIRRAIEARNQAEQDETQYRGFYVGAAMMNERGQIFYGHNDKRAQIIPKQCAERATLESIIAQTTETDELIPIIAVVVASRETNTDPNHKDAHETTLKPCMTCSSMLCHDPHMSRNTILLTINDKDPASLLQEETTLGEFMPEMK